MTIERIRYFTSHQRKLILFPLFSVWSRIVRKAIRVYDDNSIDTKSIKLRQGGKSSQRRGGLMDVVLSKISG
ncbi:hypothetical protein TA05_23975 [Citrobacter rodentium]|nr:hypothetical protein TA05_23975 [Citrobacter rodentium]